MWQTPHATRRTSTSPARGSLSSTVRIASGAPNCSRTAALISIASILIGPASGKIWSMVTVVIATPVEEELVERLRAVDDRLDVRFERDLLPPPRYPSDHVGDPSFARSPEQEARFNALTAGAEVLFGFPREDPAQLALAVRRAPNLRFVQATYAGAGQQLAAAELTREELDRVAFASSSGVHATPLAEWALFGILAFTKGLPRLLADKRARRWDHYPVDELPGATLLVVGQGAIGQGSDATRRGVRHARERSHAEPR